MEELWRLHDSIHQTSQRVDLPRPSRLENDLLVAESRPVANASLLRVPEQTRSPGPQDEAVHLARGVDGSGRSAIRRASGFHCRTPVQMLGLKVENLCHDNVAVGAVVTLA